ncbi:ABC transporter permease [Telmatospirillum siberiense]|uniref:ABC transporter permease n=1 Tax=Telmatospirillum siberiense TaxID=382514 RepID=A0A2N3PM01_9PROT|nr:ABC transporter permease [Telmatospirillum siberiense]PKU21438.1 ABC transporter permease [Telmatospirillum siberiense]
MVLRMLWRSFFEGRRRKILAAATVALAATLITTLFALSVDVGDKMAKEMTSYGSNIRVTPKADAMPLLIGGVDYNPLKGRDYLNERDLPKIKDIFWRNNIVGLVPRLALPATAEIDGTALRISVTGTYFDHLLPLPSDEGYRTGVRDINRFWQVEGTWPDDASESQALVGSRLAARLGVVAGGTLRLRTGDGADGPLRTVAIAGILTTGGEEDDGVTVPLAMAQAMAGLPGRIQSIDVSALTVPENDLARKARRGPEALSSEEYDKWYCTAYVGSIAHQIEEVLADTSARPIWQVAAGEGAVITRIQMLLLVVSAAAIAAAAMCVSALMNTTVLERAREIGLMKALGAAPWEIHLLFVGEAVIVGLIGGALGILAGYAVAQGVGWSVFQSGVDVRPITVPVVLAISVITVLAGSILPSRAIAALLPVEVLHGRR